MKKNLSFGVFFILIAALIFIGCDDGTITDEKISGTSSGQGSGNSYMLYFSNLTEYTIYVECDGTPSNFTLHPLTTSFQVTSNKSVLSFKASSHNADDITYRTTTGAIVFDYK
jgi:hypothetical protein